MSECVCERAPWLCRTCVWGFPESIGYSCLRLEGHVCSRVVVACEEYRRRCGCTSDRPIEEDER